MRQFGSSRFVSVEINRKVTSPVFNGFVVEPLLFSQASWISRCQRMISFGKEVDIAVRVENEEFFDSDR